MRKKIFILIFYRNYLLLISVNKKFSSNVTFWVEEFEKIENLKKKF